MKSLTQKIQHGDRLDTHDDPMREPLFDDDDTPALTARDYSIALWRDRWLIAAVTVVAAGAALVMALLQPKIYIGTATLAISGSKFGESASAASPYAFLPIIANHTTAAELVKEYHLDQPPYNLTPITFYRAAVDVSVVRISNLIEVSARLRDPELSARMANEVAQRGVVLANTYSKEEAVRARDLIAEQVVDLRQRMQAASERLLAFKRTAQVETLRKDVDARLKQREELPKLLIELAGERASMERAERELSTRAKTTVTTKSITKEPLMAEAARAEGGPVLPLAMKSEDPSTVYNAIDEQLAKSRAKVDGLEQQRRQLMEVGGLGSAEVKALTDLYEKEAQLAVLQLDFDISQRAYADVAARHEVARVQVASRSSEVQVIDTALRNDVPIKPRPSRDMAVGGLVGLVAAALVSIVRTTLAPPPPRPLPARVA